MLVYHRLLKMINHNIAWRTKHQTVIHLEGVFFWLCLWQLNFTEGVILSFSQRNSGHFHYKLIHEGHLFCTVCSWNKQHLDHVLLKYTANSDWSKQNKGLFVLHQYYTNRQFYENENLSTSPQTAIKHLGLWWFMKSLVVGGLCGLIFKGKPSWNAVQMQDFSR